MRVLKDIKSFSSKKHSQTKRPDYPFLLFSSVYGKKGKYFDMHIIVISNPKSILSNFVWDLLNVFKERC